MEPSSEAISVRLARLRSQLSGGSGVGTTGAASALKRALHRESLLDALTVLYDECNNDALKRQDEHIAKFVDKYRCVLTELRRMRVNVEDFQIKELIGRGHFGEVHVVREKLTGDVYAMKRLRKDDTLQQREVAFYEEERDIMALATSPWITRLQYAFQDTLHLYLVMEFCPGGDLAALLERRAEPLALADAAFYVAQLNQALNALHTCGFLHRDIKPDNILIDRCGHLKLADFGSAVRIGQSGRATSRVPIGTPDYIAPELLASVDSVRPTSHGVAVDYWSLGVVAYELVTLRTPFSERNKISAAHTFGNIQRYRDGNFNIEWNAEGPSDDYKDLVSCLLRVDPGKRYSYLEILRHPALKDMSWNTIRDQVPPFVPLVRSTDDTSHFSESLSSPQRRGTASTLRNFRSKTAFSGNHLPFIGFTFTPESYVCCTHGAGDASSSASSGGFNASLNTTAVHISSYREIEKLAERRGAEIAALHQRAAAAESEVVLQRERERQLTTLEQQRAKLEHEVTELIVHNQRLSRQLEMEHEERQDLERKSLDLIESAKRKWIEKNRIKTEELRAQIATQELRMRDQRNENDALRAKVDDLTTELRKAATEAEAMRKLQLNFKDSMAKARAVSRASIAGLATADAAGAAELARERETRRGAEKQASLAAERLKRAEDSETALKVELKENRKDYADLKERFESLELQCKKLESELSGAKGRRGEDERRSDRLEARVKELEHLLAAERRDSVARKANIDELTRQLSESKKLEGALEEQHARTEARLQDKLSAAQQQRIEIQAQLDAATQSDHRHRDKITELECLVMKLEREVSKLELQRGRGGGGGDASTSGAAAQVQLLKEQLAASDQQLQTTREELHTLKQESRKTSTALWKKEKELSDSELDRRILARELKAAEEKVTRLTEARRTATESSIEERKRLQASVTAAETEVAEAKAEVEQLKEKLEQAESKLKEQQELIQSRRISEDKLNAEIDRYKNDVRKLKCELQYSENRRLRTEAGVERERDELHRVQEERLTLHEELAGLRASLDERTRTVESLEMNNKMLQEACSMLEEQLVDLERLSDLHETKTKDLENDLMRIRTELEMCRQSLQTAESRALESQQQAASAARQHVEVEAQAHKLHRQLEDLQEMTREKEARYSQLELMETAAERDSLLCKIASAGQRLQQEVMREKEARYSQLELTEAATAAERDSLLRKIASAGQRLQQVQEECSALLTSTHALTADNMRLQHQLREAQEETEAVREESSAAAAWWRTRETKADATLRQQAKLIDFLQSKIEESGRKKKTLGDMLFGSRPHKESLRSTNTSTEITRALVKERQTNRELREELKSLKSQLPANSPLLHGHLKPESEKKKSFTNGHNKSPVSDNRLRISSLDKSPEEKPENNLRIIRESASGGGRVERVCARTDNGLLVWRSGAIETRARLLAPMGTQSNLIPLKDLQNSFTVRSINSSEEESERITVLCDSAAERTNWLSRLAAPGAGSNPSPGLGYAPRALLSVDHFRPTCVIEPRPGLYAIGSDKGLYSYQLNQESPVHISTPHISHIESMCTVPQASRLLLLVRGELHSVEMRAFLSMLERAAFVLPELLTEIVPLQSVGRVNMIEVMPRHHSAERAIICAASNRRVTILTCDLANGWRQLRTIDLPTAPVSFLFTPHTILAASERLYEIDLQRYNMEEFLDISDATLSAVLRTSSRPLAMLPIKDRSVDEETEYLICFHQVGIFVDEFGRRTRSEDVKWSGAPVAWSYRKPYLFVVQTDRVEISKLDDGSYKRPPCQCDAESLASSGSDQAVPEKCTIILQSPCILGKSAAAGALILREGAGHSCSIVDVDGTAALRKIGVSVETLGSTESIFAREQPNRAIDEPDGREDSDNESTNMTDESVEGQTNFLADIRRRAKQIRCKIQEQQKKDEAIREILSKEITGTFVPRARRNSMESLDSEFSVESSVDGGAGGAASDSATECHVVGKTTVDICNDIFLRKQVRFDNGNS